MDYKVDDKNLDASMFISFVNQVWQGDYDMEQKRQELYKTLNITCLLYTSCYQQKVNKGGI